VESLCHGIDFISTNYPFQLSSTGRALTIVHATTIDVHGNHSIDINCDYTKGKGVSVDDGDDTTASEVIGIKRALSNDERYAVKRTKIEADKTKLLVMKSGSYRYRLM
jgi:hypothetical protein